MKNLIEKIWCDTLGLHWWGAWNVDGNRWCTLCNTRQMRFW